jgi:hypothetical protein
MPNTLHIPRNVKQRSAVGAGALSISFGVYQLGIGCKQRDLRRVEAGFEAIGGGLRILRSGIIEGDGARWSEIGGQVGAVFDIFNRTRRMRGSGGRQQRGLGDRQQGGLGGRQQRGNDEN